MKEIKVVKPVYRMDMGKLEQAVQYLDGIRNITAKRCFVARELIDTALDSVTCHQEECTEYVQETEAEAKEYFGEDCVKKIEEMITYCEEKNLKLYLHGTYESNIPGILEEGLYCHINDLTYTAVGISAYKEHLYSNLLNWPHRHYKGIVMLAIPNDCHDFGGDGLKPIWNGEMNHAQGWNYSLAPEFILGALDVSKKKIMMNPHFTPEHDYSKFRLRSNEDDKYVPTDIEKSSLDDSEYREPQNSKEVVTSQSNKMDAAIKEEMIQFGKEMWIPITCESLEAIDRATGMLTAFLRPNEERWILN